MSGQGTVHCKVYGFRPVFKTQDVSLDPDVDSLGPSQELSFSIGDDLRMVITGKAGPRGISQEAADLVDFAAAVYQIEKHLKGRQRTNPPARFELSMQLRNPDAWTRRAVEMAQRALLLLGNAQWTLTFTGGLKADVPGLGAVDSEQVDRIVLFSGGMDSACGAACVLDHRHRTRLVSFYTRQKTLQRTIANDIGFKPPVQWGMRWDSELGRGRGHTYYYRSFLFLCLAAATAESWGARTILQFENGILASSIPPSPSWMMTKHAHPKLHELLSQLLSELFDDEWSVANPFLLLTKRGCFDKAAGRLGKAEAARIIRKTETCWFYASNRIIKPADEELQKREQDGKKSWQKKPGTPCGICIPCVIRRTAFQGDVDEYRWDLKENAVKNDPRLGAAFRSYFLLLDRIADTEKSPAEFYRLLSAAGRDLVAEGYLSLGDLHQLFLEFAKEFFDAYDLKEYR